MHPAHGSGQVMARVARGLRAIAGGFPDAGNYRHPKAGRIGKALSQPVAFIGDSFHQSGAARGAANARAV